MGRSVSDLQAAFRETYPDGMVEIEYEKSRTLSLIRKKPGALVSSGFGEVFKVPVKHGNPQAGSATFATGYNQSASESARYSAWQILPKTWWQFADVQGEALRRTAGTAAFVDAGVAQIEGAKDAARRLYEIMLFKAGWGELAQLDATASNVASATNVKLKNKWMSRFIERGQKFVFAQSESGHGLKGATSAKVTGRRPGFLDFNIAPNTAGTAAANGDFMFRDGDREDSNTPTRKVVTGFKAWAPSSDPTSDLFNGVNRQVDYRLTGCYHDAKTSGSPEEAFMDGMALVGAENGQITHIAMGPETYNRVCKSMNNHLTECEITREVGMGIPAVRMRGQDALIYSDSACEEGIAMGFNIEDIEIRYAGQDLIYLEQFDGLTWREIAGTEDWRARLVTSSDLVVPAPSQDLLHIFNL